MPGYNAASPTAKPAAHVGSGFSPARLFVSRFVSQRVQSHVFSTGFRSFGESQKTPKTSRKGEK
jgi:hypothetical protein